MQKATYVALAGLMVAAASVAGAQASAARKFTVTPDIGVFTWDNASALANKKANAAGQFTQSSLTASAGLTASYNVWERVGIGFYFNASRPTTRGDYFPALLLKYGNDIQLRTVSQRLSVLMYGVQANYGFSFGRLEPFLTGGLGGATTSADPQQNDGNKRFTNSSVMLGGGVGYRFAGGVATLNVANYSVLSWKRDKLNPVDPSFANNLFPTANGTAPADKSTINNIRVSLGFRFVPKLGGTSTTEDQE